MTEATQEIGVRLQSAVLSDSLDDDPPYRIHGVALAPGDITTGKNGTKKWTAESLEQVAATLEGRSLVRDHINSVIGNVGEIVKTKFDEEKGVLFEAELDDKDLAEKINNGRLEVSARIKHLPKEHLEYDENEEAWIIEGPAAGDNISIVNSGASSSNEVEFGAAASLSAAELADEFDLEGEAVLESYHTPSYDEVVEGRSWDGLNLEDFDTEDLSDVDDHFIVSDSDFPPENFSELSYEVVDTDGALVREAVDSAWRLRGNSDNQSELESILMDLNEEFDDPPIDTETEENAHPYSASDSAYPQGRIFLREQVTDGSIVEVSEATYEDAPFFISIHPVGDDIPLADPPLASPVGESGPYDAGQIVSDERISLRGDLDESQKVYAVLHYSDGLSKGEPIVRGGCLMKSGAVVRVEESVVDEDDRRVVQFSDESLPDYETEATATEGESETDEKVSDDESEQSTMTLQVDDPVNRERKEGMVSELTDITTMRTHEFETDELPDGVEELSDPVVVDDSELDDLREKAQRANEDFDELRSDISELSDIKEQKEDLEDEVEELREKAEAVEEVKRMHAEELSEAAGDVIDADDFMHLDLAELRERVQDLPEDDVEDDEAESEEAELSEPEGEPQSGDVENEELEDEGADADEEEVAELKEKLDWYETRGWDGAAAELREEIDALEN